MRNYFDISPEISPSTAVLFRRYPVQPRRVCLDSLKKGDNLLLSAIPTSVHVGAHADAPEPLPAPAGTGDRVAATSDLYLGDLRGFIASGECRAASESKPEHYHGKADKVASSPRAFRHRAPFLIRITLE